MLRDVLAALALTPTATGLEVRLRLGMSRERYEDALAHLIRLGYVDAERPEAESCPTGACAGCPIACQSSPALGPQRLTVTDRGRHFLARRAS